MQVDHCISEKHSYMMVVFSVAVVVDSACRAVVVHCLPIVLVSDECSVWEVVRKVRVVEAHWRRWVCKLVRVKRMRRVWAALGHRLKDLRDVPRLM